MIKDPAIQTGELYHPVAGTSSPGDYLTLAVSKETFVTPMHSSCTGVGYKRRFPKQ